MTNSITIMDYPTLSVYILLVILANAACQNVKVDGDRRCKPNSNETCKVITECPYVIDLMKNTKRADLETLKIKIRSIVCGYMSKYPMVCCPTEMDPMDVIVFQNISEEVATNRPKLTTEAIQSFNDKLTTEMLVTKPPTVGTYPFSDISICGQVRGSDRIYGGSIAAIDEYPWLARVKYIDMYKRYHFLCSASLITNHHAITAAHCFSSATRKAVSVRFGEWNTESPTECSDGICPEPPVEVEIEKVISHPGHSKINFTVGDVAIIRLKKPVTFTDFIQPICLPTTEYVKMQDYLQDGFYWTSGWGVTEFEQVSVIKRKVQLDAVPIDLCLATSSEIPTSSAPNLICAGGRLGKDSCRGDSGGPLMREVQENYNTNWYLFGITSFGPKQCGSEGKPGVYTRISKYMDWIQAVVMT